MSFENRTLNQGESSAEKPNSIRELIGEAPNAILVISGASKFNEKKQRYEMGAFGDVDDSGMVAGGKDRIIAGAEVHAAFPTSEVVTMSQNTNPDIPTYAAIQKQELIRKGIPEEQIIEEGESYRTIDGLKNTLFIAQDKGWKKIVYVTSGYHVPRVQAFLDKITDFSFDENEKSRLEELVEAMKRGSFAVQVVSAEEVLSLKDKHYATYFEKVKQLPGYIKRVEMEKNGVQDIHEGRYRYTGKK